MHPHPLITPDILKESKRLRWLSLGVLIVEGIYESRDIFAKRFYIEGRRKIGRLNDDLTSTC